MDDESITSFLLIPKTQYFLNKIKENKTSYQHIDSILQAQIIVGNYQLFDVILKSGMDINDNPTKVVSSLFSPFCKKNFEVV